MKKRTDNIGKPENSELSRNDEWAPDSHPQTIHGLRPALFPLLVPGAKDTPASALLDSADLRVLSDDLLVPIEEDGNDGSHDDSNDNPWESLLSGEQNPHADPSVRHNSEEFDLDSDLELDTSSLGESAAGVTPERAENALEAMFDSFFEIPESSNLAEKVTTPPPPEVPPPLHQGYTGTAAWNAETQEMEAPQGLNVLRQHLGQEAAEAKSRPAPTLDRTPPPELAVDMAKRRAKAKTDALLAAYISDVGALMEATPLPRESDNHAAVGSSRTEAEERPWRFRRPLTRQERLAREAALERQLRRVTHPTGLVERTSGVRANDDLRRTTRHLAVVAPATKPKPKARPTNAFEEGMEPTQKIPQTLMMLARDLPEGDALKTTLIIDRPGSVLSSAQESRSKRAAPEFGSEATVPSVPVVTTRNRESDKPLGMRDTFDASTFSRSGTAPMETISPGREQPTIDVEGNAAEKIWRAIAKSMGS